MRSCIKESKEQDAEQRYRPLAYPSQAPQTPLRPDLTKPAATRS